MQDPFLPNLDDKDLIVISASELVSLYFTNSKISFESARTQFQQNLSHLCI